MALVEIPDLKTLKEMEGQSLPPGQWLTVTQEMINDFAQATQDFQWLHVDAEKAATHSPFKKTIAHGFMSVALLSKLLTDVLRVKSATMGINYGLNKVRFPAAVLVDSDIRLLVKISTVEAYAERGVKITWQCQVEIKGHGKPACVAEFLSLMFEP
ncbi:MaoC family dehydratase [Maribacter sp. 2307ULW6-5]|uniref:MaoC family dehydratase n=1 Tax=Maribacter sp. 2307ULW6-5 TaxID=3386275 RepID=UPI0039BC754C